MLELHRHFWGSEHRWWITTWKDVRGFLCMKACLFFFLALRVGLVIHYIELVFLKTVFAEVQHHIIKTCNYFQYTLCFLSWDIVPLLNWKHRGILGRITLKDCKFLNLKIFKDKWDKPVKGDELYLFCPLSQGDGASPISPLSAMNF